MMNSNPFSITFSFPLGPDGPQIIEKNDWPGKGIVFSRPVFDEIRNHSLFNDPLNPLIKSPGVYILWERGEEDPHAYIGESEDPSARIYNHGRDEDKEFWTWAIIFGGDRRLNKAHIQYLEAELVALAEDAKRCRRVKANTPRKRHLGMADKIKAEGFLRNMLLCLPIFGVNFFEKPSPRKTPQTPKSISTEGQTPPPTTQRELFLTGNYGVNAKGYWNSSEFVVLEGSKASKTDQPSLSRVPRVEEQREKLSQSGVWKDDGETFVFAQDYAFNSPSRASSVCLGRTSSGLREWKDENGLSLKDLLKGL